MDELDRLNWNAFYFCCGVIEVGGFSGPYDDEDISLANLKKIVENDLKTAQKSAEGLLVVTLANYQWPLFEPILLKRGFKTITETLNPNTDRTIRTYMWFPEKEGNKYVFA